jgi:hypothetical protein
LEKQNRGTIESGRSSSELQCSDGHVHSTIDVNRAPFPFSSLAPAALGFPGGPPVSRVRGLPPFRRNSAADGDSDLFPAPRSERTADRL